MTMAQDKQVLLEVPFREEVVDRDTELVEYWTIVLLKIICEIKLFSVTRQR